MIGKEFFKPTIAKIFLTILLLLTTYFIPKYNELCGPAPSGVSCENERVKGIGYPLFYGEYFMGDVRDKGFFPMIFISNLIMFYIASCLLMFGYGKLKARGSI